MPEVFGNAVLVNGKLLPYLDVEPRKYRLRILSGSNGRFYRLFMGNGVPFAMIGSDHGLPASPVELERMQLAPAERADLIVDFSRCAGQRIVMASGPGHGDADHRSLCRLRRTICVALPHPGA